MYAERVKILHRCDGEAVVVGVAYDLKLYLLPSLQALLDEHLWRECESRLGNLLELSLCLADTRAESAERVSRAYHYRISNLPCSLDSVVERLTRLRYRHLEVDLVELLHEEVAVLGVHDGLDTRTEHPHPILLEHSRLEKLCANIETCLSAPCQHDAVGALLLDNLSNKKGIDWQEINLVSNTLRGLDSSHVRIDEYGTDALLAERFQRLRARVVKFTCLSYLQGARAQDKNLLYLFLHCMLFSVKIKESM